MQLATPQYLLLALPLLVLGWRAPGLGLRRPRRIAVLVLLLLALARPQLSLERSDLDLWVLVDRSLSAASTIGERIEEWEGLLEGSRRGGDAVRYVDFAEQPVERRASERGSYFGGRRRTNLASALSYVLAKLDKERPNRLLLLTDGYSTESLEGIGEQLALSDTALDYRLVAEETSRDAQVSALSVLPQVQPGEPFLIEADIESRTPAEIPYELIRDGVVIHQGTKQVGRTRGTLRFTDRLDRPGAHRYEVKILPDIDAHAGNNSAQAWLEVAGAPRVLLLSPYENDPVREVIAAAGFAVEHSTNPASMSPASLSGVRTVVLNNVPANLFSSEFLQALDFFVQVQGAGLIMAGGSHSFGTGGYFGSAVDELLPVSMELREEQRRYSVAMAIVMDRSGSMSAGVAGVEAGLTKMDLANEGAAQAIALLGERDEVAVYAVDSSAHLVVPLIKVGGNRTHLQNTVRGINSEGGGIFVYEGLSAAWDVLKRSRIKQRHVILFSDAADSEEPGEYRQLLAEMAALSGTVSVIGLGTKEDPDAELLADISRRGGGRLFFTTDANQIPVLFAQETASVARSAYIDEPARTVQTGGWKELAAGGLTWLAEVDGYNLSYLRKDATAALVTAGDEPSPLVSYWQRGNGRVGAVSFPLSGESSERTRAWPEYGDFLQTLVRWSLGSAEPNGIAVRSRLRRDRLELELFYEPEWEEKIAANPPQALIAAPDAGEVRRLVWERLEPGRYFASAPVMSEGWVRGAVQIGETVLPFGPLAQTVDPEWSFEPAMVQELKEIARMSGGGERLELASVWDAPRPIVKAELGSYLMVAVLLLVLIDALLARIGPAALPALEDVRRPITSRLRARWTSLRILRPRAERARTHAPERVPTSPTGPLASGEPLPKDPLEGDKGAEPSAAEQARLRRDRFSRAKKLR